MPICSVLLEALLGRHRQVRASDDDNFADVNVTLLHVCKERLLRVIDFAGEFGAH
jgi:hypothetical protein